MSFKIIEETLGLIEERTPGLDETRAEDVCIGLGYTGVRLNTGHVGVCYTLQSSLFCGLSECLSFLGLLSFGLFDISRLP